MSVDRDVVLSDGRAGTPQPIEKQDYPALFLAADAASQTGRKHYFRLVRADLLLLLAGATLSTFAPLVGTVSGQTIRSISVALLVLGFVAKTSGRIRRFDNEWYDGRAVSESVKTLTWRFMMHVPPFDLTAREAELRFGADLREIIRSRSGLILELGTEPTSARQVTPAMREMRTLDFPERRDRYLSERIDDQIRWYAGRAERNRRAASRWFWLGLAAQSGAIGLTIVRIVVTSGPDFVALAAAISAMATAWTQINRNDELAKSYGVAAQELILLKGELESVDTAEEFARVVDDAESAVSREHTMWMAKRG
jgi:hypothetical protein